MKIKFILFFVLIASTLTGFSQNEEAERLFLQASQAVKDREFKDAIKLVDQALAIEANAEMYWLKYFAYNQVGEFDKEFQTLNEGLNRFPKASRLYASRGLCERRLREFDASIRNYNLAIKYAETDSAIWSYTVDLAWVKFLQRDYDGCRADCRLVLEEDSLNIRALSDMAMAYEAEYEIDLALSFLNKILTFDSTNVTVIMNMGFVYQKDGQYEKSIEYFDRAIALDPTEGIVYNNRAYSKMKLNDLKGALLDVNKSMELFPNNSYAYRNRALIYIEMGKTKKACKDLESANAWGFTISYGNEVIELQRKYCK